MWWTASASASMCHIVAVGEDHSEKAVHGKKVLQLAWTLRSTCSRSTGLMFNAQLSFRNSYPDVLVMQPSQDRNGYNGARPLDSSTQRQICLKRSPRQAREL